MSFSRNRNPFYQLRHEFPTPLLGKLAVALYKRSGNFVSETLNLHLDDYDIREEIIHNHIIPEALAKPHYLQLQYNLTSRELEMILSLPEIKGKLKRLIISTPDKKLPQIIKDHITLKELVISQAHSMEAFPVEIYDLKRLSTLQLALSHSIEVDQRLSELKQLKVLQINNKQLTRLHVSIKSLPKITRIYCSGVSEYFN